MGVVPAGARPAGTFCVAYEDGYIWIIRRATSGWERRVKGGHTIQMEIESTGRYEHILRIDSVSVVQQTVHDRGEDLANNDIKLTAASLCLAAASYAGH
jgi:hypothetical protein